MKTVVGYYVVDIMDIFYTIFMFMVSHFFADWVMQSRKMAENKSKSWYWLSLHVLVYTVVFTFNSFIIFHDLFNIETEYILYFGLINGALHFITDAITSRFTTHYYTTGKMKAFWTTIGFDQLIHQTCIFVTLYYLLTYGTL